MLSLENHSRKANSLGFPFEISDHEFIVTSECPCKHMVFFSHSQIQGRMHRDGGFGTKGLSFARPVRNWGVEVEGI